MAQFLRDEHLKNLTLTEERLTKLHEVFFDRWRTIPEGHQKGNAHAPLIYMVIRFDNKGYRVFNIDELISYFRQADYVERVVFTVQSPAAFRTNHAVGSFMELRLDHREENNCFLQVSSDDGDWVDASFSRVKDALSKFRNKHFLARNNWTLLALQLAGLLVGFALSLWAALTVSPYLQIRNGFLISFFLALLIFSQFWGVVSQRLVFLINSIFPNVRFFRSDKDKLHWLAQALIAGLVIAFALFLIGITLDYIGQILADVLPGGAP